jgi:hypothetical protein
MKACYLRRTSVQHKAATEEDTEKSWMQFWKDYDTYNCIKIFAWRDVNQEMSEWHLEEDTQEVHP